MFKSFIIYDVSIYQKDYPDIIDHHFFLFKKSADKFMKKISISKNYKVATVSGTRVWNWCGKIEIPED